MRGTAHPGMQAKAVRFGAQGRRGFLVPAGHRSQGQHLLSGTRDAGHRAFHGDRAAGIAVTREVNYFQNLLAADKRRYMLMKSKEASPASVLDMTDYEEF